MDLPCVLVLNTLQTWLKDLVRKSSYCQDLCTIYFTYKPFVLEGYDTTESWEGRTGGIRAFTPHDLHLDH